MKRFIRFISFILFAGSICAQSSLPTCRGEFSSWSDCFGEYTSSNGNKYVGEWKNGTANGQGTYLFLADNPWKGDKYDGEFRGGKRNGQGTFTYATGEKYVGEWKDGNYNGQGTSYASNGSVMRQGIWIDGSFVNSSPVQQATTPKAEIEKQSNLPACQGGDTTNWSNCTGTKTFPNDTKYVGEFKDGKLHGQGTATMANGDKYLGEFKDNNRSGQGTYTYANGAKYAGEFKDSKQNGQGTLTFADGNKYVGEHKDGKMQGQGTLYSANGLMLYQGIWDDDIFIRSATVQQATAPTTELEKLRTEAELERKRRQELEEQLRLAQQQTQTNTQTVSVPSIGRRVALVVGNANYKVRPLKNPRNDADDISRSLRSSGFEVIDLRDASLQQMRTGVRQFGDRLINNDVGLVYYSGHGVEVKGRNYFIPVNADIMREDEIADQGLDVSLILEKMNTAGKGVNILIVDACRDDPFGRSFRSSSRGLAQMDAPRGTIIAYATSPGKVASDGDPRERNSPYTKNLVKAMQQPNKPIEQVFKEVRRAVQEETKNQQTPWENTSLSGDFYFKVTR